MGTPYAVDKTMGDECKKCHPQDTIRLFLVITILFIIVTVLLGVFQGILDVRVVGVNAGEGSEKLLGTCREGMDKIYLRSTQNDRTRNETAHNNERFVTWYVPPKLT
jgi:hypothetical protein